MLMQSGSLDVAYLLAPKNTMVEAINKECLEHIPCVSLVCHSTDAVVDDQNQLAVPPEYLHTLLPPHTLALKRGIPLMLLRTNEAVFFKQ